MLSAGVAARGILTQVIAFRIMVIGALVLAVGGLLLILMLNNSVGLRGTMQLIAHF
jgi:hypothetical protein